MPNAGRAVYDLFLLIQDSIGPKEFWPVSIQRLFWQRDLRHWERVRLAAFFYINGLNPEIYEDWGEAHDVCAETVRHILALLFRFEFKNDKYNLWGYNVVMGRYEDLQGNIKNYW